MTKYPFENLVFEGGGVKGIAYGGAISVLEKAEILKQIKKVGGASAGAITALLVSLDFNASEISKILKTCKFGDFADKSYGFLRNGYRLFFKFGIHKGDVVKNWLIKILIKNKINPDITFIEIRDNPKYKELHILGTNLSRGLSVIFNADNTPAMSVIDAVRISMSIPVYFVPIRLGDDYYVDGGILNNYPVKIFDEHLNGLSYTHKNTGKIFNANTLGLRIESAADMNNMTTFMTDNFIQFITSVIDLLHGKLQLSYLIETDWYRTCRISSGDINATDFDLSDSKLNFLIRNGITGTVQYLTWFDKNCFPTPKINS